MKIVEFKAPLTMAIDNKQIKIKPKNMYLFADVIQMTFKKRLIEIINNNNRMVSKVEMESMISKVVKYEKNIDDVLGKFNFKEISNVDKKTKHVKKVIPIILRTGGIGDLIALSSISHYIPNLLNLQSEPLKFVSQEKYRDIFDWFETPIKFVSYFSPIDRYQSNSVLDKIKINNKYKTIYFEGVIENSKDNWFNIQYDTIGCDNFNEEYGRPRLKTTRISDTKSNIDLSKKSVLINCRSTAIIRSMRFQDIYESLIKIIGDADINIYTHNKNIRDTDLEFINSIKDDRLKIIDAGSLSGFLLDAYDATLTISVDTALLHFREGIEKAGVGIYGPFPYECRTKYYTHTKTFNITSNCDRMPCYIHVKKPDAICEYQKELHGTSKYDTKWHQVAPCCCQEWNNTAQEQIVNNSKEYILSTLQL